MCRHCSGHSGLYIQRNQGFFEDEKEKAEMRERQPLEEIVWIAAEQLKANDYNPNVVANAELNLLKLSILKNGWIQPVIVNQDMTVIDGFHRYWLTLNDKQVAAKTEGACPCVIMELTEAERMLLTIRINRAKGSHVAFKMAEIVKKLITEYDYSPKEVAKQIGATKAEIDLLLQEDVFKKLDIENHSYSKAWYPK
jgi:ParB-like chromosome segregation protein Spo0J